jgi:hypothetical protein
MGVAEMLIVYGVYRWWPKRIAFRNDYCLRCGQESRAEQIRSFDVGHIFWIPILPSGFWKHWYCVKCRHDPHEFPGTRRIFKWIGLVILILLGAAFWATPVGPDFVVGSWMFRIGASVGALLTLAYLLKTPKDVSLNDRLARVQLASDGVCPFCQSQLMVSEKCVCPKCAVVRL